MTVTQHIRRRPRRQRVSRWYADRSHRPVSTVCGAAVTDKDVGWRERNAPDSPGWQKCPQCLERLALERRT